ncbi:MAG: hypothetical protein ACRDWI_02340 [Jiangellaceae bacterium]
MTPVDDALARALQALPVGSQPAVEGVSRRAHTIRTRRRAATGAVAAFAIVAVAVPTLWYGGNPTRTADSPVAAAPSTGAKPCLRLPDGVEVTPGQLAPADVPDEARLLWSESAADAPISGTAEDLSSLDLSQYDCPAVGGVRLVDVDDGVVVTRVLAVWGPSHEYTPDPGPGVDVRTLRVGSHEVSIATDADDPSLLSAWWYTDGGWFSVAGQGRLSDAELEDLVDAARVVEGVIDVGTWSVAQAAEHMVQENGAPAGPGTSFAVSNADGLMLAVSTPFTDLWAQASPGDEVVEVNGRQALYRVSSDMGPTVDWAPEPGVLATLMNAGNQEELLRIAETVEPIPADDGRLQNMTWENQDE